MSEFIDNLAKNMIEISVLSFMFCIVYAVVFLAPLAIYFEHTRRFEEIRAKSMRTEK